MCILKENVVLNAYGSSIVLKDNVVIGQNFVIYGNGGVHMGDALVLGPLSLIVASSHVFQNTEVPFMFQGESRCGLEIADNVWGARNVTVCDGVKIGANEVIRAGV